MRGILSELEAKAPEIQRMKDDYAEVLKVDEFGYDETLLQFLYLIISYMCVFLMSRNQMSQSTYKKLEVATKERMDALAREDEAQRERAYCKRELERLKQRV